MSAAAQNANESYCTFTLAGDVTAGGLPSEADIRKDLEHNDPKVRKTIEPGLSFMFFDELTIDNRQFFCFFLRRSNDLLSRLPLWPCWVGRPCPAS